MRCAVMLLFGKKEKKVPRKKVLGYNNNIVNMTTWYTLCPCL